MEVPFICWCRARHHVGTHVMAPPGAHMLTPSPPSMQGPRLDHVKLVSSVRWLVRGGENGESRGGENRVALLPSSPPAPTALYCARLECEGAGKGGC